MWLAILSFIDNDSLSSVTFITYLRNDGNALFPLDYFRIVRDSGTDR
jgi:hypothetical protein